MASDDLRAAAAEAARTLGLEAAHLLAVAEVETGLRASAAIDGRAEPLIRFEGHYFDRRLSGERLARARAEALAAPTAGAIANPASQAARWRMLARAAAIDRKAAWESTSWGLGQVMGAHWAWLGFAGVDAMVEEARSGAAGQFRLMARYIDRAGLAESLRGGDWPAFARGYNGPAFRRNAYDAKIEAACRRHAATGDPLPGPVASAATLHRGARGSAVRALQQRLARLGHALAVDGIFGPRTEAEVRIFQRRQGLVVDGIVGPRTAEALARREATGWLGRWIGLALGWLAARLRHG